MANLNSETLIKANNWLTDTFDQETKNTINSLLETNPKELEESFYKNLEFGTGGMRGVMGVGTNRINKYTLGKNTQGLSNYLHQAFPNENLKVAIAYDCRHNSKPYAKLVADVFSANNIKVYLFEDLRPTPELSFSVKHLGCDAGIVLTASHNPPEYNGYKVYWNDGGQIVPPQDGEIITEVINLNFADIKFKANESLIEVIGKKVDDAFIDASVKNGTFNTSGKENLKIVFTSLHGTSIKSVPDTLAQAGYTNVNLVPEQSEPNGNFPTVKSPNPEERSALEMAINIAKEQNAELVLGTDPDTDRVGLAIKNNEGDWILLNGNQAGSILINYL